MSMSPDDAEYSALLHQLLADSAPSRNARVHSWIEHQYDFVHAEHPAIDRPDSPLLPRPSYDALFFPTKSDDTGFEEQERVRALRFIVQEMAHWKSHARASPRLSSDKPLPAPPPSPASTQSSRAMRSRSSSTRISRLPSFTSTLSSDQSSPQELPPLPLSVIVHSEFQNDLVLSRDRPLIDGYFHKRDDSFAHSLLQEQDGQLLSTVPDDLDSALMPSPTFSGFSGAHSRDTSFTTATSPVSAVFCPSQCSPQDIALPLSPVEELSKPGFFPSSNSQSLRAPKLERSQSRWSIATTASNSDTKSSVLLNMRLSPKDKSLKTPNKKRARLISLISRFSPGRNDPSLSTSTLATDDFDCDSLEDSDSDDKDKSKPRKSLSKKSSLASLRASFSISRASFSSQRPSTDQIPPLPTSPTSPTVSSPLAEAVVHAQPPKSLLSKIPSRPNVATAPLPSSPQSASMSTSFQSSSCDGSESCSRTDNVSRVSLLPPPSKRTSLASAAGIKPMAPPKSTADQPVARSKSIFRLAPRPKSLKAPPPGTKVSSKLPHPTALPLPTTVRSRIPQSPPKFNPPTKLATVIATQTRSAPLTSTPTAAPKLPMPPSRIQPKLVRPLIEKPPAESLVPSSRLPTASKSTRVGTVKGFWKRQ